MAGQIVNQAQTATPGTPVTVLHVSTTSQATTGTSEEVLATYTLPANTLSANGKAIKITAWGGTATNGNSKSASVRFGGISGTIVASWSSALSNGEWIISTTIVRTGAATQLSVAMGSYGSTAMSTRGTAPTQTLSNAVDIVVTGTTATSAGDVTFKGLLVEALN